MQTSLNKEAWKEDPAEERERTGLKFEDPAERKRALFPLSCRMLATSKIYPGMQKGYIIRYARTRMTPAHFPIEALLFDRHGARVMMTFSPREVEIIRPVEDA